jgi:hypothetical protein
LDGPRLDRHRLSQGERSRICEVPCSKSFIFDVIRCTLSRPPYAMLLRDSANDGIRRNRMGGSVVQSVGAWGFISHGFAITWISYRDMRIARFTSCSAICASDHYPIWLF